jgi:hypothetical protein
MRLQIGIPEGEVDEPILNAALESVTRLDERLVGQGIVPTFHQALQSHGIQWRPEPPGAERFDHAAKVIKRGWGDCDDLAPWRAASMRHTGEDPGATAIVVPSGPNKWHAVVQRSDGKMEDPSREAGMGRKVVGQCPPVCAPMFRAGAGVVGDYGGPRAAIAIRPNGGRWEARTDLPWSDTDASLVALQRSPVAAQALVGSMVGACLIGESAGVADPEEQSVLMALADILSGHPVDDCLDTLSAEGLARVCNMLPTLAQYCNKRIAEHVFGQYQRIQGSGYGMQRRGRASGMLAGEPGGPMLLRF